MRQSFIGIGDWNVDLAQEDSRTKLIHQACRQLKLSILKTDVPKRPKAGTYANFVIHGSKINISLETSDKQITYSSMHE